MINADDEVSLAYLIDPTFEIVNTEGRPLTGGYIEVYLHGTRTKYYCYSDWSGTLHPFKIPLDSLGANIILASPAHSYDIYVYNKYSNLVMSRYNVVPATGDGSVIKDVVTITSDDNTVAVTSSDQTNWNLSIQDTVDRVEQNEQDISDIQEDLADKKDKQSELVYGGNTHLTITKISQNENGEITEVKYEPIDLPPQVPNVEITSPNGTIDVQSSTDVQTNTKTFTIDVKNGDVDYYIGHKSTVEIGTSSYDITTNLTREDGNINIASPGKGIYLVSVNLDVRPSGVRNEQHEIWMSIGPNNASTLMQTIDWTNTQEQHLTQSRIVKITGNEPILISLSYGSTPSVGLDLTVQNVSVYRLDSVLGQGGGTTYTEGFGINIANDEISVDTNEVQKKLTAGSNISIVNDVISSDITIGREANSVIDDTYDGVKIRQTDNGNEVVGLRKNDSWLSYGQLAPLSAGADKILITDSNGTLRWGVVGDGLELDNDTLKTSDEVSDVVETVEKLEKDLDTKVISTFPIAQITDRTDFANMGQQAVGAKMLCQAFIIPINQTIRINSADEEEPTLLGVYATQDYNGKIMLALYCYDFNEGSSDYVGDTGPINIRGGLNEYPLVHINPNYNVLSSDKVYYASLYLPSQHNSGLFLASCPAYSMQFNSMPRFTVGVYNITHDNQEIDMTDATTGRLDFNDGNGNYQIGPWSSAYNESNYNVPRLFMQIRNGHWEQPVIPTFPFEDIGTYTLILDNGVDTVFGNTSILNQSANYYPIWQTVSADLPVDIVEFTIADGNPTHNPLGWNQGGFGIFTSNFGSRAGQGVTATITDTASEYYETYYHKYTLSSPIHLDAHVPYRFPAAYVTNLFSRVRQYGTPNNPKTLFMSDNISYIDTYSTFVRADNVQGTFLKVKDSNNNEYVI